MKRYEEYKDSDVQWFGKIPSHWIIGKLKYMAKVYTGKTPSTNNDNYYKEEDINWITPGDISDNNYYIAEVQNKISRIAIEDNACQLYPSGSIFVVCVGTIGKVCLTTFDASCNQQINVLVPNGCNNKFLTYYIMSIKEILKLNANASLLAIISQEKTKNIVTLIPPINEQQSIASFLDAKTKPIDDIISKREKQIELLEEMKSAIISHAVTKGLNLDAKMKDSGIEWIGEVPEHWIVEKAKFLFAYNGIKVGPFGSAIKLDDMIESGYKVYGQENVINKDFSVGTRFLSEEKYNVLSSFKIEPYDILITMMGTIGKCMVTPVNIEDGIIDSHLMKIKVDQKKITPSFFAILIEKSKYIQTQLALVSKGSIMSGLNSTMIKSLNIVAPPLYEQKCIISYLDSETSKIDARITKRRRQIELLQEYKQALITDAVTGKIDVREYNKRI